MSNAVFYCGIRLRKSGPAMRTKDHLVPKSKGGTKIVEACLRCNGAKADKSLEDFRRIRGGIEFYGEMQARLEIEKTAWICEFHPENNTFTVPSDSTKFSSVEAILRTLAKKGLPQGTPDLRGVKFGGFTVIRWAGRIGTGRNGKPCWEVACRLCGAKEYRTSRAIRNPKNTFDACVECRKPVGKLHSDIRKEFGVEVTWDDCFQHIYGAYLERDRTLEKDS